MGKVATGAREIRELLRSTWNTPEAPLALELIVVEHGYAIAGWTQGEWGGRALRREGRGGWVVVLCDGESPARDLQLGFAGRGGADDKRRQHRSRPERDRRGRANAAGCTA